MYMICDMFHQCAYHDTWWVYISTSVATKKTYQPMITVDHTNKCTHNSCSKNKRSAVILPKFNDKEYYSKIWGFYDKDIYILQRKKPRGIFRDIRRVHIRLFSTDVVWLMILQSELHQCTIATLWYLIIFYKYMALGQFHTYMIYGRTR